jgi:hypothetical protein
VTVTASGFGNSAVAHSATLALTVQ